MEKSWNCIFEFLWEPCSIDRGKRLDDSAINGLEGILNGNISTADNLNVLESLLEWPPSKYSSTAGLFHK